MRKPFLEWAGIIAQIIFNDHHWFLNPLSSCPVFVKANLFLLPEPKIGVLFTVSCGRFLPLATAIDPGVPLNEALSCNRLAFARKRDSGFKRRCKTRD